MRGIALIAAFLVAVSTAAVARAAWTSAGAGNSSSFASAAEFPPRTTGVPDVLGIALAGQTLRVTDGRYDPTITSRQISWLRCNASGAACVATAITAADYTLGAGDVGSTMRARITPRNGSTDGVVAQSDATPIVALLGLAALSGAAQTSSPTISGTTTVGQTSPGRPEHGAGVITTTNYQWRRCDAYGTNCTAIAGATSATYVATTADRGLRLKLAVTTSVAGLAASTALSISTSRIA